MGVPYFCCSRFSILTSLQGPQALRSLRVKPSPRTTSFDNTSPFLIYFLGLFHLSSVINLIPTCPLKYHLPDRGIEPTRSTTQHDVSRYLPPLTSPPRGDLSLCGFVANNHNVSQGTANSTTGDPARPALYSLIGFFSLAWAIRMFWPIASLPSLVSQSSKTVDHHQPPYPVHSCTIPTQDASKTHGRRPTAETHIPHTAKKKKKKRKN